MQRGVRLRSIEDMRERYAALDPLLWRNLSIVESMIYEEANAPQPAHVYVWDARQPWWPQSGEPFLPRPFVRQIPAGRLP